MGKAYDFGGVHCHIGNFEFNGCVQIYNMTPLSFVELRSRFTKSSDFKSLFCNKKRKVNNYTLSLSGSWGNAV